MYNKVTSIECKEKMFPLDGKPVRLEVWGGMGVPMYFTSFSNSSDCEKAKSLIHSFVAEFRKIRDKQ